jgi:hypothetical protein
VTTRFPSLRIRSLVRVSTGDHSISSCDGGGSSVMIRVVCGRGWEVGFKGLRVMDDGLDVVGPTVLNVSIRKYCTGDRAKN